MKELSPMEQERIDHYQRKVDLLAPGRFSVLSWDSPNLVIRDRGSGHIVAMAPKSILRALRNNTNHSFTRQLGRVDRAREAISRLGVTKYKVLGEKSDMLEFRDTEHDFNFVLGWKTFRKHCLDSDHVFRNDDKIEVWQRKLDDIVGPHTLRILNIEQKKNRLLANIEEGQNTFKAELYRLAGKLKEDESYRPRETVKVGGFSLYSLARETGYSVSYLYHLHQNSGVSALENIPDRVRAGTVLESEVGSWLAGEEVVVGKALKGESIRPDFWLPKRKVVIECDGLYWHAENNSPKQYHRDKKRVYDRLGVRSYFFREHEIYGKSNIVRSIVTNALGSSARVFARKTAVLEIPVSFFHSNHLMGRGRGRCYGLALGEEVVAGIQVKWVRKSTGLLEVSRFCTKLGVSVIGGFSKLIAHVKKEERPSKIVTYIDRRYGDGSYLQDLGWEKKSEHLSFGWTDHKTVYHRMKYPGNSGYDHNLLKIWDCGQAKWELEIKRKKDQPEG